LLCTHTNSAADIHVRLLHDYLTKENGLRATRPLRIYQTNRRSVKLDNLENLGKSRRELTQTTATTATTTSPNKKFNEQNNS